MNKYVSEITSFRQALMALRRLVGNSSAYNSVGTLVYTPIQFNLQVCAHKGASNITHRSSLSVSDIHIELHRRPHCLRVETCYTIDRLAYACISDICYQGFGLGSVYQVSEGWT